MTMLHQLKNGLLVRKGVFIIFLFIIAGCSLDKDENNPMYGKMNMLLSNVKLYHEGYILPCSDIFYTHSYLSLVTGHMSLIEHHDATLYMRNKDYKTDMRAWKKWLNKNKNKMTIEQMDSIYQARTDSTSMVAWNKWLEHSGDNYNQRQKDSINLLIYGGVALSERPKIRRFSQKYDNFHFLSDTTFKDFNHKMNKLIQNVKKFYHGKPVGYTDVYYAVNYLGFITGVPSRIHFGEVTFYEKNDDFKNDMGDWSKWLRDNKTNYTLEEADNIFRHLWENLEEHPYMWYYDDFLSINQYFPISP